MDFGLPQLRALLPHTWLMLDRARQLDETHFVALKNITVNEPFFQGHFPGHPILPGVLHLEAMKQLAEFSVRPQLDPAGKQDVYLALAERVKFRRPVVPGDRIKIETETVSVADGAARVKGRVSTATGVASEATMTLKARPREFIRSMTDFPLDSDLTPGTTLDIQKVMDFIPHRFPFLLIDYILEQNETDIRAVKNLSQDEPFFAGVDPAYPVLPESLLCEILAQAGCASVLSRPENAGKIAVFMAIEKAESFFPVGAGDQLVLQSTLPPSRAKFGKGCGNVLCDGKIAFSIQMMFAVVDA